MEKSYNYILLNEKFETGKVKKVKTNEQMNII